MKVAPQDLVAVIAGGASGIGAATVARFLKAGHKVVIADLQVEAGEQLANQLGQKYGSDRVRFLQSSITDEASLDALIKSVVSAFGRIDFAVNTAGITGPMVEGHLVQLSDWNKIMDVDLKGAWFFAKAFITYFREQEGRVLREVLQRGSIVTISSSLGTEGKALLAPYCAAKHSVIGLTKALALENASHFIRINTVSPGLTLTPLLKGPGYDIELAKKMYLTDQPIGRFGHPDEVAAAVYFVASDGASFMTGADFGVDGGSHIR